MNTTTRPGMTGWAPLILTHLNLLGYSLYTLYLFGVPAFARGEMVLTLFISSVMVCAGSYLWQRFGVRGRCSRGDCLWIILRILCGSGLLVLLFSSGKAVLQQGSGLYMVLTLLLAGVANLISHPEARLECFSTPD